MKKITLMTVAVIGLAGAASAGVIWDASTANTTLVGNRTPIVGSITGTTGDLQINDTGGAFDNVGFASTSDIDTMIGGAGLTAADTLTFSAVVTGITGDVRANVVEFGMSSTSEFRGDTPDHLIYSVQAANGLHKFQDTIVGTSTLAHRASEASLKDGFGFTLVVNAAGYTFTLSDIVNSADDDATTIVQAGTFAGTEFMDHFAGGHFYLATQQFNTSNDVVMSIGEAQVSVIPEPATLGLVATFGGGIMFLRRRFKK